MQSGFWPLADVKSMTNDQMRTMQMKVLFWSLYVHTMISMANICWHGIARARSFDMGLTLVVGQKLEFSSWTSNNVI